MIWGIKKLLDGLNRNPPIVEGLSDSQKKIEGAEFDLRVAEVYELKGEANIGVSSRNTPEANKVTDITSEGEGYKYTIKPNDYILLTTVEKVNCPENVYIDARPRSTLQRSGLLLITTLTAPGYKGKLTFAAKNLSSIPITIELGARFVRIIFHEIDGGSIKYDGVWQGGKVDRSKKVRPF